MNDAISQPLVFHPQRADSELARRLRGAVAGAVLVDHASRGRYATDASIYQVEPMAVLVPSSDDDVRAAFDVCRELEIPMLPRGAGSSQCGQTVGAALVIDHSKHLNRVLYFDRKTLTATVEPGVVLDQLNAYLKPYGVWFPVDVSTSAQCTLGGMAGNNSCGSRSIAYGNMVHNVVAIEALLADGTSARFGPETEMQGAPARVSKLLDALRAIGARERDEIGRRVPTLLRRVGGYNIDVFHPQSVRPYTGDGSVNFAHLLVGSEGTLAWTRRLTVQLAPLPKHRTLGVVNFPSLHRAMECARHIVTRGPSAVELVDRTMIDLARGNPAFAPVIDAALVGEPQAILLVEFIGDAADDPLRRLADLVALMGDLGLPDCVVRIVDAGAQKALWEVRKAGLNIMMSMRGDGKPVSFIEDCAVPLEHLAEYVDQLSEVFRKHGTRGTWYAHASVGTLHVRPILDMRRDGALRMRAIAEEAARAGARIQGRLFRRARRRPRAQRMGGLAVRPAAHARVRGDQGALRSGRAHESRQDRASLADGRQRVVPFSARLQDAAGGDGARLVGVECDGRSADRDRVRARNRRRSGRRIRQGRRDVQQQRPLPQIRRGHDVPELSRHPRRDPFDARAGEHAAFGAGGPIGRGFVSEPVREALDLCVSCKGCRRDCPTGVDMAKMKIEFQYHWQRAHGLSVKERAIAYLPRWAPWAARLPWLANLRDSLPGAARLSERWSGLSARRTLPKWRGDTFLRSEHGVVAADEPADVVLFVDTFTQYFEPENAHAAIQVLTAAGYRVQIARARPDDAETARPLCCGRTFLTAGLIDEAKREARRVVAALLPQVEHGATVVGLEPSCLLSLRDEFLVMGLGGAAQRLADNALLIEEFLAREHHAGRLKLALAALPEARALLHGHCHQKAFNAVTPAQIVLKLIPGLAVEVIESSCCGMAGAFGYEAAHYDVSMRMAELSLLPAVRKADAGTLIVADGTSCRHQIADGTRESGPREAVHVVRVLARALAR